MPFSEQIPPVDKEKWTPELIELLTTNLGSKHSAICFLTEGGKLEASFKHLTTTHARLLTQLSSAINRPLFRDYLTPKLSNHTLSGTSLTWEQIQALLYKNVEEVLQLVPDALVVWNNGGYCKSLTTAARLHLYVQDDIVWVIRHTPPLNKKN